MGVGKIIDIILLQNGVGEMGLTRMEEWTTPENKVTKACYPS